MKAGKLTILNLPKKFKALSKLLSDPSLTHRASLNASAAFLEYGALVVTGLLVTPFLVSGLGDVGFGIWRTLDSMSGYLSAASGRPSQALKSTTATMQSSDDFEAKQRNVANAVLVWLIFLPLLTIIGGVLVWFAPIWINSVPANLHGLVRLATGLLVARMIVSTLADLPRSVLEGENLGYRRMGASALIIFIGGGLTLLALRLDMGLPGVAGASLVTVTLTGLLYFFVVRREVAWFGMAKPSRSELRQFFGLSGWFLLWRLVMQLMMSSDLVVLGVFASAELVTVYAITKYAPALLINITATLVFGSTPGLGGIIGSGNYEKAARVRGEIMMLTWLIVTIIGATILVWNRVFINLWVGAERYAGPTATLLILIMIVQLVLIRNDANIIDLTLDLSRKVLLGVLSVSLTIAIATVLVNVFDGGIVGLLIGFLIGQSILSLAYPHIIGKFLGTSLYSQIVASIRPAVATILLFLAATYMEQSLITGPALDGFNWFSFFLLAGLTLCGIAPAAFVLGLTGDQRKQVVQRARFLISKTSK